MHAPGAPDSIDLVTVEAVEAAARMLDGIIRTTPTEHSHTFSRILGRPVFLKHEERQRTGSFKIRGAYHC
ncbi:MAG TPA: pyridoxal-phosphate dependent enzyme, partial [Acidimicrobiia bacterium]|nr:pyridoxal-phosphate dependent enzyme [Acidimicrobiia bacterium]